MAAKESRLFTNKNNAAVQQLDERLKQLAVIDIR